jgi:hypothetical protein
MASSVVRHSITGSSTAGTLSVLLQFAALLFV